MHTYFTHYVLASGLSLLLTQSLNLDSSTHHRDTREVPKQLLARLNTRAEYL